VAVVLVLLLFVRSSLKLTVDGVGWTTDHFLLLTRLTTGHKTSGGASAPLFHVHHSLHAVMGQGLPEAPLTLSRAEHWMALG
jgi:hypothetical protein